VDDEVEGATVVELSDGGADHHGQVGAAYGGGAVNELLGGVEEVVLVVVEACVATDSESARRRGRVVIRSNGKGWPT
jgi:hypothetical protein